MPKAVQNMVAGNARVLSQVCSSKVSNLKGGNVICILYMGVSKNDGTPKSSILIGFSIVNHPFWGTPIFGNTHIFPVLTLEY